MLSQASLAYGARAATALLGVDRIYRGESGDETGLAVLNMDAEGRYLAEPFGGYEEARSCFEELAVEAESLPEDDRRLYYGQLCRSTLAFIEWRTNGLAFEGCLGDFLHVPVAPASDERLNALRAEIRTALAEMGYKGDLRAQASAWEERMRVPPESVHEVLTAQLEEAWDRTETWLGGMPADKSDGMGVEIVTGEAYNARCDYRTRTIQINVDPVLTKPSLKHLAIHEGYPGHYLQFKVRETMAAEGTAAPDVLLSVVNTASSSVFEGIADHGGRMIGWESSPNDTVQSLMTQYRAGIGTGAAWRLHGLEWSRDQVTDWLREQTLVGGEGWVLNRMAFIEAPSRAVLIWSYWWGEQSVRAAFDAVGASDQHAFFRFLYGRMHSTKSVRMFRGTTP